LVQLIVRKFTLCKQTFCVFTCTFFKNNNNSTLLSFIVSHSWVIWSLIVALSRHVIMTVILYCVAACIFFVCMIKCYICVCVKINKDILRVETNQPSPFQIHVVDHVGIRFSFFLSSKYAIQLYYTLLISSFSPSSDM